jgi:catechol 2,3-dioxygenase-like lactoylglutathione lyase family enzyme
MHRAMDRLMKGNMKSPIRQVGRFSLLVILLTLGACSTAPTETTSDATSSPALIPLAGEASADYLGAVGIGVSDLDASTRFYQAVLGLVVQRTYELGYIEEVVLGYPGSTGTVLVLMHWPGDESRRYDGNDVKNVFYVDDPVGAIARIRELGGSIDREAIPHKAVKGALVGLGRDPDNYVVEVISRP